MKEMVEENREQRNIKQKGTRVSALRVITLLGGLFWLLVLIKILQIGYLTWIGITVMAILIVPLVISPMFGFAGMRCSEKVLFGFWGGLIILIILVVNVIPLWSDGNHIWRPYRFDAEIAAAQAKWAVPENENAAFRYESLFNAMDMNDRPDSLFRKDGAVRAELMRYPWKREDYPEVSQWLDLNFKTIEELLLISEMTKCRWPIMIKVYDEFTVPYKPLSYSMYLLTASGNRDLGEGRFFEALEKSFCLLRMAGHLYQQSHSLDYYCGCDRERVALKIIGYTLVQSDLSRDDINRIAEHLPTTANNWRQDISRILEFEKLRFVYLLSPLYEINERGDIRFTASLKLLFGGKQGQKSDAETNNRWRLYWLMNMPVNPDGLWGMAEDEAAGLVQFLESDPVLDVGMNNEPFVDFCIKHLSNIARWTALQVCFNKYIYTDFSEYYAKQMTLRCGTWLVLGLRLYRDAYGTWPESLEQISEYVPPEAFLDPVNDDRFVYVLDGDGFKLYSRGINNIDEGGRSGYLRDLHKTEDDILIWPPRE